MSSLRYQRLIPKLVAIMEDRGFPHIHSALLTQQQRQSGGVPEQVVGKPR